MELVVYLKRTNSGFCIENYSLPVPMIPDSTVPKGNNVKYSVLSDSVDREPEQETITAGPAHWFDLRKIHPIEVASLPEFFSGNHPSKAPTNYMNLRNTMIKSYLKQPSQYLAATVCRKGMVGDALSIVKLHHYLEHWSLINTKLDSSARYTSLLPIIGPASHTRPQTTKTLCGYCGDPCYTAWYFHELIVLCVRCFGEGNIPVILSPDDFSMQMKEEKVLIAESPIPTHTFVSAALKQQNDIERISKELGVSHEECVQKLLELPVHEVIDPRLAVKFNNYHRAYGELDSPALKQARGLLETFDVSMDEENTTVEDSEDLAGVKSNLETLHKGLEALRHTREFFEAQELAFQKEKSKFLLFRITQAKTRVIPEPHRMNILKAQKLEFSTIN